MDHARLYKPSNNRRDINNPQLIDRIVKDVKKLLKREVGFNEKAYITNYIRKLDPETFKKFTPQKAIPFIVKTLAGKIQATSCEEKYVDMQEYTKKEIGISGEASVFSFDGGYVTESAPIVLGTSVDVMRVLGASNSYEMQQLMNPRRFTKTILLLWIQNTAFWIMTDLNLLNGIM